MRKDVRRESRVVWLMLLGAVSVTSVSAGSQDVYTLRVLFIGNSFSLNTTTYLVRSAEECGHVLTPGHAEIGGCPRKRHWRLAQLHEKDPENLENRPYIGKKSLQMLLTEGLGDVETTQQYPFFSSCVKTYRPYARQLYDYVQEFQPEAHILS